MAVIVLYKHKSCPDYERLLCTKRLRVPPDSEGLFPNLISVDLTYIIICITGYYNITKIK